MTEETKKKVVSRTVAIVLGIICIILSAGLVTAFALYLPAANSVSRLNSEIATKNSLIASQNATIASQSQQIVALQNSLSQAQTSNDEQIDELNEYISDLLNILYLNASTTLLQNQGVQLPANSSLGIWDGTNYPLTYAGFITVQVQSDSNTTYAQVAYSTIQVNYDESVVVGANGAASFPILPTSVMEIRLGNTEASNVVNATVTATYHY